MFYFSQSSLVLRNTLSISKEPVWRNSKGIFTDFLFDAAIHVPYFQNLDFSAQIFHGCPHYPRLMPDMPTITHVNYVTSVYFHISILFHTYVRCFLYYFWNTIVFICC